VKTLPFTSIYSFGRYMMADVLHVLPSGEVTNATYHLLSAPFKSCFLRILGGGKCFFAFAGRNVDGGAVPKTLGVQCLTEAMAMKNQEAQ